MKQEEQPDAPLHGECAFEISRLTAERDVLQGQVAALRHASVAVYGYIILADEEGLARHAKPMEDLYALFEATDPIVAARDAMVRNEAIDECAKVCRKISETEWKNDPPDHAAIPWSLSCAHTLEELKTTPQPHRGLMIPTNVTMIEQANLFKMHYESTDYAGCLRHIVYRDDAPDHPRRSDVAKAHLRAAFVCQEDAQDYCDYRNETLAKFDTDAIDSVRAYRAKYGGFVLGQPGLVTDEDRALHEGVKHERRTNTGFPN